MSVCVLQNFECFFQVHQLSLRVSLRSETVRLLAYTFPELDAVGSSVASGLSKKKIQAYHMSSVYQAAG